jgi:L-cysteine desulfidase
MEKTVLIEVLKREIEKSIGCTDPGAICLAVSRAVSELKRTPEKITVTVSPNVYKNAVAVGVPGTGGAKGLLIAAALGATIEVDGSVHGLAILDAITENNMARAQELIRQNRVTTQIGDSCDPLYIRAEVHAGGEKAVATIENDYSNIVEVSLNDRIVYASQAKSANEVMDVLKGHSLQKLFEVIAGMGAKDLGFLLEGVRVNREAAEIGMRNPLMKLGPALLRRRAGAGLPDSAVLKSQLLTGAAGEARMFGLKVPIMAIAGSGNHGITNFLGVVALAEELGSDEDELARALAISSTVTVYIKGYVKRMTAFCGCAVAAATGVAAGAVYLLGGTYEDAVHAMQTVIGTLSGMLCDGANESCAYKVSTAAAMAIQFAYLALDEAYVPRSVGIVGNTIEETFENLGQLNNPGMVYTDLFLLELIKNGCKPLKGYKDKEGLI